MTKITQHEGLCKAFLAKGYTEITQHTSKRRCFISPDGARYYVGKKGSVRKGPTFSDSYPINPDVVNKFLLESGYVRKEQS